MVEAAQESWRALVGAVSRGDESHRVLTEAIPLLPELIGARSVAVLCANGDGWDLTHHAGQDLAGDELAARLAVRRDEQGDAADLQVVDLSASDDLEERAQARRLPGGDTWLLQVGGVQGDADSAPVAVQLLVGGLERCAAVERLHDLSMRVDSAQQLANMGDYDWHIESDTNQWSDQLYRIYGHEPQSFNPSYDRFLSFIHPDDRERIQGLHQAAYATGEPYAMVERIVRLDGEVRYLSSNGQVVMDDGRPVRMRGTCVDITARVLAEQDHDRAAAMFQTLVESSPDAILVMDAERGVVQANGRAHELLGGDPVGRRFHELVPEADGRSDGAISGSGVDGRMLLLDVVMADLSQVSHTEVADGSVAAFLHDAAPRLHNEAMAAELREVQVRRRQAMEINDNVVQGLSSALYTLREGQTELAGSTLERTLASARRMMSDLLEPSDGQSIQPGDLVRSAPSTLDAAR